MSEFENSRQLVIVEKYDDVIAYLYPILHSLPKSHAVLRRKVLDCLLEQPRLFIEAGKSGQVSRLYAADANLALLRWYLRFLSDGGRRLMGRRQTEVASVKIAEVGQLLGAWIRNRQERK
ncbi:MAG: diversity-generating retroelement protein Avd [Thiothrix sp.]|nr:diversity-generating retroelement protein Avd [Thiothrix sp.]HPQ94789.1 diversity-generating retroelement protein Avd [Thiolinea sp.]